MKVNRTSVPIGTSTDWNNQHDAKPVGHWMADDNHRHGDSHRPSVPEQENGQANIDSEEPLSSQ